MVLSHSVERFHQPQQLGVGAPGNWGLFLTPEETGPPPELASLRARMAELEQAGETAPRPPDAEPRRSRAGSLRQRHSRFAAAREAVQPGLRRGARRNSVSDGPEVRALGEKLLDAGPDALNPQEKMLVLSDADVMSWLHRNVWMRPTETFAPWWQEAHPALRACSRRSACIGPASGGNVVAALVTNRPEGSDPGYFLNEIPSTESNLQREQKISLFV